MVQPPLVQETESAAKAAGMSYRLVRTTLASDEEGDGEVVLVIQPLLIRVLRERSRNLVYVAPERRPGAFHLYYDLEIAFGLRSMEDVLALDDPDPLEDVFSKLKTLMNGNPSAFSEPGLEFTFRRIESAAKRRKDIYVDRLRRPKF